MAIGVSALHKEKELIFEMLSQSRKEEFARIELTLMAARLENTLIEIQKPETIKDLASPNFYFSLRKENQKKTGKRMM